MRHWHLSLCMAGVVRSAGWIHSTPPADQTPPIQSDKYQCSIDTVIFSWWWAHGCPKHGDKRNKYIKQNCAPSWIYLREEPSTLYEIRIAVINASMKDLWIRASGRMTGEWWFVKNLERSYVSLAWILQRYLVFWTQENHDKPYNLWFPGRNSNLVLLMYKSART
jgi:hypothetical protein